MDYRSLFGIAAIILSGAVFMHSLNSANAFPQGPNVSTGSNPIESWAGSWDSGYQTVGTVSQDFIITDFILSGTATNCIVTLTSNPSDHSSQYVIATGAFYNYTYNNGNSQFNGNFNSGIRVPAGTTIHAYANKSGNCLFNITGYYTH